MLQKPARPRHWRALSSWLMESPEILENDDLFEYIKGIVSRWPAHIRVTPKPWVGLMWVGHTSRYFELCARIELIGLTEFDDELRRVDYWEHPQLDVSPQHWAAEIVEDGPHTGLLEFLWEHPASCFIQELDLSTNSKRHGWWNNDRAFESGAEYLSAKHIDALVASPDLTRLRSLSLRECELTSEHIDALAAAPNFRARITSLDLSWNFYGDNDALDPLFVEGRTWPSLEELDLGRCYLSWACLQKLLNSANFPALRHIKLTRGIDHRDTNFPKTLDITLPSLRSIDLSDLDVPLSHDHMKTKTPASPLIEALQRAHVSPSLRTIKMSRCKLDATSLTQLLDANWFGQIECLDIGENEATLSASHAIEIFKASPHTPSVLASKRSDEVAEHELFDWLAPSISDLNIPEPGRAWWAWMYDKPTFAGYPIRNWSSQDAPLDAAPPEPSQDEPVHVPRVHIDQNSPPALGIARCPAPVEGMMSFGTSRYPEEMVESFIERFGESHQRSLEMLTWHDVSDEVEQPSWLNNSDVALLLRAFPNLRFFGVKGGNKLRFGADQPLHHDALEALTIITGGLPEIVVEDLVASHLPALRALELWFGVPDYGLTTTIEGLAPILRNQREDKSPLFPSLDHLGLCNCMFGDELIEHLIDAPIMRSLDTLDMRHAGVTDQGLRLLVDSGAADRLRRLFLNKNLLSDHTLTDILIRRGVSVSWGDWQYSRTDSWDYYIEVAE